MPYVTGKYVFSPALSPDGNRVRRDGTTTDWWLIIQCDRELGRYLRHLYKLEFPSSGNIGEPLWGAHVSIVQNEKPPNLKHWQDRDNQEVTLEYEQVSQETDGYIYHAVVCEEALNYRELLGLSKNPKFPLHLTIGNRKNT